MELLLLVIFFVVVAASLWFSGFWGALIATINIVLAASFASAFFEPVADQVEYANKATQTYSYMIDIVVLWGLFFVAALFIRALTDSFSAVRLKFDPITEIVGRTIMSLVAAWIFICFAHFTLITAPLPETASRDGSMLSPDRVWLGYLQSRSRGALSEFQDPGYLQEYERLPGIAAHPDDADLNARVFDPRGLFSQKYAERRSRFSNEKTQRVARK